MVRKNDYLTEIDKIIGRKIYSLRLAKGLSRVQVAEEIEVTHQQLQKYEKGLNRISVGRLMLIARTFGVNISNLLKNIESDQDVEVTPTQHQSMCIEVSRGFMEIRNPKLQEAINVLVRSLSER